MNRRVAFFLIPVLLGACSSDYSPKPTGYFNIEMEKPVYSTFSDYPQFEFSLSAQVKVPKLPSDKSEMNVPGEEWFNLIYPSLNAQIYCSYIPVEKNNLVQISEESRKFVYLHVIKADAIHELSFENPEQKVYGLIYEVKGNVASPLQFVLTDSVNSFFRGALYFNNIPNQDSIAPVLEYIKEDIYVLIDSFRWKKQNRK
jgi:gliding motility-associated lipoprotein GldD